MEKTDIFVRCPRYGTACDIDTCPRFLQNAEVLSSSDGKRTASGFCLERGSRYITDVPEKYICDRNLAAAYLLMEKDAREETSRLEHIRHLVEDNCFFIVRQSEDDKPLDPDAILFDTISEFIEHEIKDLDKGKMSTPNVACSWQNVLPEMLSFPDDEAVYYIEKDIESHPEAFEHHLPNGEKVWMNIHYARHHLSSNLDRVKKLTGLYLQRGLLVARQHDSSSKEAWLQALGDYNRVNTAWQMPQSRPILEDMAKVMIDAATHLAIDLSLPDTSTSIRDNATAEAVAERLQPSFDEQRRSLANITRIVKSTGDGLRAFFGKFVKWFVPRRDVTREEVAATIDKVHRYDCLARIPEPHKSQIKAVIDYTYEHPIVYEKNRKFGKDAISLSEAAQIVFDANIDKWRLVPGAWTDFNSFKSGCYQHRGKDNDPYHYKTE